MKILQVSASVRELIEADLRRTPGNHYVIARRYGVTKGVIAKIVSAMQHPGGLMVAKPITVKVEPEEIPARIRGYVLQIKAVNAPWVVNDELKRARQEYDDGEVELTTGRLRRTHGDALVLYRIPRKKVDASRRPYFSAFYEG
jgi:hypothetical protein